MIIATNFIIALSLSMDAFSLSLLYGTLNLNLRQIRQLSLIVGIFHFIMPLIGLFIGEFIINNLHLSSHIVVAVIFGFIGIEMINSSFKKQNKLILFNFKGMLLFALTVSIDSLSAGAGLKAFSTNYIITSFIFFLTSGLFTYLGLKLGKKINEKVGSISTIIGGSILTIIGLLYLILH